MKPASRIRWTLLALVILAGSVVLAVASATARAQPGPQPAAPGQVQPAPQPKPAPQPQAPQPKVTAPEIDAAIERAVNWLWSKQLPDGLFPYNDPSRPDEHVMAVMALEHAGTPLDDPRFAKALELLLQVNTNYNYIRCCRVMTLAHQHDRSTPERRLALRKAMVGDVEWLVEAQSVRGGWRYDRRPGNPENVDNSVSGFAVAALAEAIRCGIKVPKESIALAHQRMLGNQLADGGWNYGDQNAMKNQMSYGSMTASALASLMLTTDLLYTDAGGCPCRSGRSGRGKAVPIEAVDKGLQWLANRFQADQNTGQGGWFHYWLYQAERVGLLTGLRDFGKHDWYAAGAAELLKRQEGDGKIGNIIDTSFALVFLVKGRTAPLIGRLRCGDNAPLMRADLANLTDYIARERSQPTDWQTVGIDLAVAQWHETPILYLLAEKALALTPEQKKKLRRFTDEGGTMLLEASCGAREGKIYLEQLIAEVWPEWPLEPLEVDHPFWMAETPVRGRRPPLMHLDDGLRTFLFFSAQDLSCQWHTPASARNRPLFDLGLNLAVYATDREAPRRRLAAPPPAVGLKYADQKPAAGAKKQLTVARVRHAGRWNAGANYQTLERLAAAVARRPGLTLKLHEPVAVGQDVPKEVDLLYLTGRAGCDLGEGGTDWLKKCLDGGAFLLAEAAAGDKRFDEVLRKLAADAGLELKPFAADSPCLTGKLFDATGFRLDHVAFSRSLEAERAAAKPDELQPLLHGIYADRKLVGIYSPYDLLFSQTGCRAFGLRGLAADDATALATNILLVLSIR